MSNTIILVSPSGRQDEITAGGAISPGDLIELDSSGEVVVHSTEGGYAERMFAVEDALQGNTIDDAYAEDALVTLQHCVPGDEVFAYIKAGESIAVADKLISGGDGTLIEDSSAASATTVRQIIAVAVDAKDLSASGAVDTRTRVRLL